MAEKDLRKVKRSELVRIIYELQQKEKDKTAELEKLRNQLNERTLRIENAGSIAEAALAVNEVVEKAQSAADQYLDSVYYITDAGFEGLIGGIRRLSRDMLEGTSRRSLTMLEKLREFLAETLLRCDTVAKETEAYMAQSIEEYNKSLSVFNEKVSHVVECTGEAGTENAKKASDSSGASN